MICSRNASWRSGFSHHHHGEKVREAERRQAHAIHCPPPILSPRPTGERVARCATAQRAGRGVGSASSGMRPPIGASPRLSPRDFRLLAQLQARFPGTRSSRALPVLSCPSPADAPCAPAVVPANVIPEAAPERVASPRGGTALAPCSGVPREHVPYRARFGGRVTEMGTNVKPPPSSYLRRRCGDQSGVATAKCSCYVHRRLRSGFFRNEHHKKQ
jgi:hypothetical protein